MNQKNKRLLISSFIALTISLILVLIDQVAKYFAVKNIKSSTSQSILVIKDVFRLTYLENKGAAWGMFPNMQLLFIIISIILLIFIGYYYCKIPFSSKYLPLRIIAIILFAGAVGNMIDRILHGYVIDFFEFLFISFPVFNVADIYVTVSASLLLIFVLVVYKEEDLQFILKHPKNEGK